MLVNKSEYLLSAVEFKQFPHHEKPQYLLMGRSNVGKSSFINAVCNRKNLAFTSSKPGKTETLNFYLCNDAFMFVDAPGYGYAKKSKEQRVAYGNLLEKYLKAKINKKGVFLIIDSRHNPTEDDILVYEFLNTFDIDIYVVATKIDKLSKNELFKQKRILENIFTQDKIIYFSAVNKIGVNEIEEIIKEH